MGERRQRRFRQGPAGHPLAELLERGVEGHQALLAQQRLEPRPEQCHGFDEDLLAQPAFQLAAVQAFDAQAQALGEPGLGMEGFVQR